MRILGIETSCDETSASVVKDGIKILSNVVSSSAKIHSKVGGIIPEIAAREQLKFILPVINQALEESSLEPSEIEAMAVTYGPGLIGSLLVGIETAKALSYSWKKPLIPVNHLLGHIYANFLDNLKEINFPNIALVVSGGHTDLLYIKDHKDYQWLGGTRDDAAGETFDKTARLLGLPYPGGPEISRLAEKGKPIIKLPRPMINDKNYDFSFSGLKTAVLSYVKGEGRLALNEASPRRLREAEERIRVRQRRTQDARVGEQVNWAADRSDLLVNLAASIQEAIVDVLVSKTIRATKEFNVKEILLSGGVAANKRLKEKMIETFDGIVHVPPPNLCTDNGAMIASAAFFNSGETKKQATYWKNLQPQPNLHF